MIHVAFSFFSFIHSSRSLVDIGASSTARQHFSNQYRQMPALWVIFSLSYNRWAVEALSVHTFQHLDAFEHHLGLTRMLAIGFCNNQAHGMPSFELLSRFFLEANGVHSFTEGLDQARPILGAPGKPPSPAPLL
eukprot:jgi/Botrbrau1/11609/Bobra.247_1s0023.1